MSAVGLFGGTFNPIHYGHLRLAEECLDSLHLTQLRLIPAGIPPHRELPQVSAADRLNMVRLAVADNPRLRIDSREIDKTTPCYTLETLQAIRAEVGAQCTLVWLIGADAFLGLPRWHQWQQLFDLVHFAVIARPNFNLPLEQVPPPLAQALIYRRRERLPETPHGSIVQLSTTALDIASTTIRSLIGRGHSPRYLLPSAVLDYIRRHSLYL